MGAWPAELSVILSSPWCTCPKMSSVIAAWSFDSWQKWSLNSWISFWLFTILYSSLVQLCWMLSKFEWPFRVPWVNLSHWWESSLAYKHLKIFLHVGNVFFICLRSCESRNISRSECIGSKAISILISWDSLKRQYILDYECHVDFWYFQNPAFSLLNSVCNLKSYKMVPGSFEFASP